MKSRQMLISAAILLALATALGAFGVHALRPRLEPARFAAYESAVQYQFWQALGLMGIGLLARGRDSRGLSAAAWLLLAGIVLFAGSIYAITFGAPTVVVMAAPLGGSALVLGWIVFAVTLWRTPQQ